jgi:hypothetical protein
MDNHFETYFDKKEYGILSRLNSPADIQAFLDEIPYSKDSFYRSPASVLRDGRAHCFDGALFAAAALCRLGEPPRIIDMIAERDDDHLLAVYKLNGHWGSVAKSNFVGLRFREPIFRNLRELVLSYFEDYYNVKGEKTLRAYTVPLDLRRFDGLDWMRNDERSESIAQRLDRIRKVPLLTKNMVDSLSPVDKRSLESGLLGADTAGLYRP